MRCCGYRLPSGSPSQVNGRRFTIPVAVPEADLPLVFSFSPSINTTPALALELYDPGMLMFVGIQHDRVDRSMRYIGVAIFEPKGKSPSKEFIAATAKDWVALLPILFQE